MSKSVLKKQATVTSKGQITIPHEVRRNLGVRAGDKLVFAEDAAGFRVETVRTESPFTKYRGIGNPGIRGGRKSVVQAVRKLRGK
jgi:AbrB family looped-hinge helix DNA binding protein